MKNLRTNITGLSPNSRYKFRVRAENSLGIGEPSAESGNTHQFYRNFISLQKHIDHRRVVLKYRSNFFLESYTTSPAPPYRPPMQVGGGGGKVGDLVITWEPLPPKYQNGEGICYIVYWKKKFLIDEDFSTVGFTNTIK